MAFHGVVVFDALKNTDISPQESKNCQSINVALHRLQTFPRCDGIVAASTRRWHVYYMSLLSEMIKFCQTFIGILVMAGDIPLQHRSTGCSQTSNIKHQTQTSLRIQIFGTRNAQHEGSTKNSTATQTASSQYCSNSER